MRPIYLDLFVHGHAPPGVPVRGAGGTIGAERGDARGLAAYPLRQGGGYPGAADPVEQVSQALGIGRFAIRPGSAHQGLGVNPFGQLAQDGRDVGEVARVLGVPNKVERGGLRAGDADLAGRGLDADGGSLREVRFLDEPDAGTASLDGALWPVGDHMQFLRGLVRSTTGKSGESPAALQVTTFPMDVEDWLA